MKFFIVSLALVAVVSAQYGQQQPQGGENIAIVRQSQDQAPNGEYKFEYETANGIVASEQGQLGAPNEHNEAAINAQGYVQYTAPDGSPITLSYTADENGFQPQGDHLPTSPPIPEEILRSLEYNAAHPEENDQQQQQQYRPQYQ